MIRERDSVGAAVRKNPVVKRRLIGRMYERFFDGYTVVQQPKTSRYGYKYTYIYTADYYMRDVPSGRRAVIKLMNSAAFLAAAALFIGSATVYGGANMTWYVTAPQAVCTAGLGWLGLCSIRAALCGPKLTGLQYRRSSLYLIASARLSAAALAAECTATLLYAILRHDTAAAADCGCAAKYCAAAAIVWLMGRAEKTAKYLRLPAENELPEGMVVAAYGEAAVVPTLPPAQ